MHRIEKVRRKLEELQLDGALFFKPENRFYLSGFTGSTGYVLITKDKAIFITDFRYDNQAKTQCKNYDIEIIGFDRTLYDVINEQDIQSLGFEDDFMSFEQYSEFIDKQKADLIRMNRMIEKIRLFKDEEEIEEIQKAQDIADKVFEELLDFIKPGMTEKEVYHHMLARMRAHGASGESFTAIVASGERGSMPHGLASDKVIEKGDLLTLDFGCIYNNYCSDMTRTIAIGPISDKQKEIYEIVLEAEKRALAAIKPGVKASDIDKIARDYITEKGYGENFGHGLGHGVGLEVHEAPRLSPKSNDVLEAGMVITDEPGIYIDGFGGVRIEDIIVVTEDSCRVLSKSNKELVTLDV